MLFVVALGGLGVTALTVYLNHRERIAPLRTTLYGKQLDVYPELLRALSEFNHAAVVYIGQAGHRLANDAQRNGLRAAAAEQQSAFGAIRSRHGAILPRGVLEAAEHYHRVFLSVSAPLQGADQYPPELVSSEDPALRLSEAYSTVVQEVRAQIGTDPLGAQTIQLPGAGAHEYWD